MRRSLRVVFAVLSFWLACSSLLGGSEWRQLVRGPVVLACREEDVKNGERVISIVEGAFPRIARDLGLSTMGRVTIIIASSEGEFRTLTGGQIPEWGVGAADPHRATVFLKSPRFSRPETSLEQVVVHELSHVMLGMIVGGREVDRWFDEGFAQYESGERGLGGAILLGRSFLTGQVLWLDEIDDVLTFRREKAALAYRESCSAVDYLVEMYGKDVIPRIVWALREGKEMDGALNSSIGVGFQDFQAGWYRAMKRKYRWYILLDVPLVLSVAFTVLFFTAFFVTRRRSQRKRRVWEEEEASCGFERLEEDSTSG